MKTKDTLRITLAQIDLEWENPSQNLTNVESLIRPLKGLTDLVILPETFNTGFTVRVTDLAEPMDGTTIQWMSRLTRELNLALCGSILVTEEEKYFNRFLFVTPDGVVRFYNKRHLFSIGQESELLTPGDQRELINYLGWGIAPFICYDIRFPVWCRNRAGADLMIFSANWPESRVDVWNTLLKARAIENQVYVAGVNRTGTDGLTYSGNSQIINARGEITGINNLSNNDLITYNISKQELADFRIKFPVSDDADSFVIS